MRPKQLRRVRFLADRATGETGDALKVVENRPEIGARGDFRLFVKCVIRIVAAIVQIDASGDSG